MKLEIPFTREMAPAISLRMFFPLPNVRVWLLLAAVSSLSHAATMDITPGLNNVAIQQVVYNVGGSPVTQNAEASGVVNVGNSPVYLQSITAGGQALTFFNTSQAKVFNVNPQLGTTSGVGVFDNNTTTVSNGNLTAYADAVAGTSMDTDLRNYGYHDFLSPGPTNPTVADLDLHFAKALNTTDFLVTSERWGNSSFQLLALAQNGEPYTNANILRLGGPGNLSSGYGQHDWNTGYASLGNVPDQAQALTLFSVAKFFEGTSAVAGPVYGLRIFNYDEADVKILGISADTFANNPDNMKVVPEPTALLLSFVGMFLLLKRRVNKF